MKNLIITIVLVAFQGSQLTAIIMKKKDYPLKQVFAGEHEIINPKISPNGNYLAFTNRNFKGIKVYDIKRRKTIKVTDLSGAGLNFTWAPGSFRIVYKTIIMSRNINNNSPRAITMANVKKRKKYAIEVFDIISGFKTQIYESFKPIGPPIWDNNGRRIYFLVKIGNKNIFKSYAFVYDRKSDQIQNKKYSTFFYPTPTGLLTGSHGGTNVEKINPLNKRLETTLVSPNKKKIIFETITNRLYLSNIDGSKVTFISLGTHPQWAKDSSKFVFVRTNSLQNTAYSDIFLYSVDEKKLHKITNTHQAMETWPIWSHSNNSIFYSLKNNNGLYVKKI